MSVISRLYNNILLKYHNVQVGENADIIGYINVFGKNISIGNNILIRSGKKCNPSDGGCYTCIFTMYEGKISIGNNVGISNSQICAMDSIVIEDDVLIGGNTKIYDNDFHPISYEMRKINDIEAIKHAPVHIKKGVFIGTSSIILKGVTIGENSIIGAGSVVTSDIPDGEIWAGNPAKFVKKI